MAQLGIPILPVKRHAKSKIDPPKTFTPDNTPKDRALGIPMMKISEPYTQAARFLRSVRSRIPVDTTISNIEIEDVNVAKSIKMKKTIINIFPNGICSKIAGNTTKIKPGPSAGDCPSAKTAGKITSPANIEIIMFNNDTFNADCPRRSSRGK